MAALAPVGAGVRAVALGLAVAAAGCAAAPRSSALGVPPGEPLPTGVATPFAAPPDAPWRTRGYRGGVVAASEPEAAAAGAAILRRGGNAVDAAAATQFALNVVEPQSSGVGGGAIAMIHLAASGETFVLDAREAAPVAADPGMFDGRPWSEASRSGRAVGVPGLAQGVALALERWGTMSLAGTLAPAIALAEDGFPVGPRLARAIADGLAPGGRLASDPGDPAYETARATFAPGGAAPAAGSILRQPDLARAFRILAERGPAAFSDCADPAGVAASIVAAQAAPRRAPGRLTCADLAAYAPVARAPLTARHHGVRLALPPPPSSGGVAVAQALGMLERFPIGRDDLGFGFAAPATLTVTFDALRLAFADRAAWLGDPAAFADRPAEALIAPGYLARRAASCPPPQPPDGRACLDPARRLDEAAAGDPWAPPGAGAPPKPAPTRVGSPETTHFTVIDRWGNIVAWTGTIEAAWGAGLMVPGFGFLLNNELTDFNVAPQGPPGAPAANDAGPARRPRSNMTPAIAFVAGADGVERPALAFGSPGGAAIIAVVLGIAVDAIDHRLAIQTAVDAPRFALTSADDERPIALEPGFPPATVAELERRGYVFTASEALGSVQAIAVDSDAGVAWGAADGRRRGAVEGLD